MASLATLNLSQNAIERIDAGSLAALPSLTTLNLSRNRIQSADDIAALSECPSVTNLDLSHNDVDDEAVVPLLATLPALACLTLTGNPFLRTMRQFRKTTLAAMPRLAHLDDRPVFEEERVAVAAWKAGGSAAERTARKVSRPGAIRASVLLHAHAVAACASSVPRAVRLHSRRRHRCCWHSCCQN